MWVRAVKSDLSRTAKRCLHHRASQAKLSSPDPGPLLVGARKWGTSVTMIYEGDLRANTNDDLLDCFAYDKIEGSLIVEFGVTTIDLPDLVEITGDLVIVFNDFPTDIRGLGSLKKLAAMFALSHHAYCRQIKTSVKTRNWGRRWDVDVGCA